MRQLKLIFKEQWSSKTLVRLIFFALFLMLLADYLYFLPRIYHGVQSHQLYLGGKTIKQVECNIENMTFTFTGPRAESVEIPLQEIGVFPKIKQLTDEAYSKGRIGGLLPAYLERWHIKKKGAFISLQFQIDQEIMQQSLAYLENTFNSEPENAFFQVSFDEQEAKLIPELPGYLLNQDELMENILKSLTRPNEPLTLTVPSIEVPAKTTESSLREKGIKSLMVSFFTRFDPTKANRVHNIELAASHLNGLMIAPGKIFSLNSVIGNTTVAKGYKEAPVIVGGVLSTGIGGGLCQVSSNLYNAALLADLPIIERHNHRLAAAYLPPGRDAAVEYGSRDFMFRNNTDHYILINAVVFEDILTIRFFGEPLEKEVIITRKKLAENPPPTRYKYDPELAADEEEVDEGTPGYIVEVWKTVYLNGEELSSRKISVDSYFPNPTIIRYGS